MRSKTFILFKVAVYAFISNLIWEELHAILYQSYKDGPVTQTVLLRSTVLDALYIIALAFIFLRFIFLRQHLWLSFVLGIVVAVCVEWYALHTGLWAYASSMPIIPIIHTGLTPTIQLGLLSYLIFKLVRLNKI